MASSDELFELNLDLPNAGLEATASTLIGFDDRFLRVGRSLEALLDPDAVAAWAKRFHASGLPVVELLASATRWSSSRATSGPARPRSRSAAPTGWPV